MCDDAKAWIYTDRIQEGSICLRCGNLWQPQIDAEWPPLPGGGKAPGHNVSRVLLSIFLGFVLMLQLSCSRQPGSLNWLNQKRLRQRSPTPCWRQHWSTKGRIEKELNAIANDIKQNNAKYDKLCARGKEKGVELERARQDINRLRAGT